MADVKNGIILLHPTDSYSIDTKFVGNETINTITYSDGTIVVQTITKDGTMNVHVVNRSVEYSEDGKTAWVKK